MEREALAYAVELAAPHIKEVNGEFYSDKTLKRVVHNPKAEAIKLTTLRSLVDYIKSGTDIMSDKMIIHVESSTVVSLYSCLDLDRGREYIASVYAELPSFSFGKFIEHERFLIGVQSTFISNNDKELLLKFAGTVENGTIASYGDDGVTQKATVKTGVASKSDAVIPSPVKLKPYRTFTEVEQPESSFIFRMKEDKYEGIQCALFEADGGAWKLHAMAELGAYTGLGFAQGLQRETQGLADIITGNLPTTVQDVSSGASGLQKSNQQLNLTIQMDGNVVGKAALNTVDMLQGAKVNLTRRGIANA